MIQIIQILQKYSNRPINSLFTNTRRVELINNSTLLELKEYDKAIHYYWIINNTTDWMIYDKELHDLPVKHKPIYINCSRRFSFSEYFPLTFYAAFYVKDGMPQMQKCPFMTTKISASLKYISWRRLAQHIVMIFQTLFGNPSLLILFEQHKFLSVFGFS